ncbi:MAG: hypothetical protein ACK5Y2_11850 [Bdellovibrionales bacterium]
MSRVRKSVVAENSPHSRALQNNKGQNLVAANTSLPVVSSSPQQTLTTTPTLLRPPKKRRALVQQSALELATDNEHRVMGSVNFSHSRNLVDFQDGTRQESRNVLVAISGRLLDGWNLAARASLNQDLRDTENKRTNGASDTVVTLIRHPQRLNHFFMGNYSISTLLPTSEFSQRYQNLQGSLGGAYRLRLNPEVLVEGLDLSGGLGANRLFHQFETDRAGTVLNQYLLRENIMAIFNYKKITMTFDFTHFHAWSYQGAVRQFFEATQEVGFMVMPQWLVSVGHTNSDWWLRPNGQDSNLRLINENNSIVYLSTSVMF